MSTTICIASSSGGTGKSTIAKELAILLQKNAVSTCLIDLDLNGGSQNALFHVSPKHSIVDWLHDDQNRKKDNMSSKYDWKQIQKYLTYSQVFGCHLLPAPSDGMEQDVTPEELSTILYNLKSYFDAIIIDTGNHLDLTVRSAFLSADMFFLIATPTQTSQRNAEKLLSSLHSLDIVLPNAYFILNRCHNLSEQIHFSRQAESYTDIPVCCAIPEQENFWMYNNAGLSILQSCPSPQLHKSFQRLLMLCMERI